MGLNSHERQQLTGPSARPLRASNPRTSGRMERKVQACMIAVGGYHMDFIGRVIAALGESLSVARESAKAVSGIHPSECCKAVVERSKKAPTPLEIGVSVDSKINAAANQLFSDIFGVGVDIHAQTPIQKTLYEIVTEALADGYAQAEREWDKIAERDEQWALSNPFPKAPIKPNSSMRWLQNLFDDGFTSVRSKIFEQLAPDIKQSIIDGVTNKMTMREIARDLYAMYGGGSGANSGYLWQWQRLVRTEMHKAMFTANNEEYRDCGAKWVRWSVAVNGCKICQGIQSTNSGYYSIDAVPAIPHPNCRCSTNPVFNLPRGISV